LSLLVTGPCGFIGSRLAKTLVLTGRKDLILSDSTEHRSRACFAGLESLPFIDREGLPEKFDTLSNVEGVIHLGACTDTGQTDVPYMEKWNTGYTRKVWSWCAKRGIPLVYASSAATYGRGENGYSDDHSRVKLLQPLNLYGRSKHDFDVWALSQDARPNGWWGLKFFNVYGPGEGHKGRMASSIFHGYHEIAKTGKMTLFKSHKEGIADGQQKRDFVFVDDIVAMCLFCLGRKPMNGLYNAGSGTARPFLDLSHAVFAAMGRKPDITWVDTPEKYREGYQYFTQAEMEKMRGAGFEEPATTLEDGVRKYVRFLQEESV
jgi:ADP-L-glycero-D-manno-heptose 6-epimerase